jgi:hypothetical protein
MNLTDLPKTPDEEFAAGAAHAFKEAGNLLSNHTHKIPCAAILARIEQPGPKL